MAHSRQTIGVATALLLAAGAFGSAGADAAPQGAPPPAVTAGVQGAGTNVFVSCAGDSVTLGDDGLLRVARGNATSGTIDIDVSYGGTLDPATGFAEPLPDPITIPAGDNETVVEVDPNGPGTLRMTIEPGAGYTVGDPATASDDFPGATQEAICAPLQEETIAVGQAPTLIDLQGELGIDPSVLDQFTFSVEGDPPPGVTVTADGTSGTATTRGVYEWATTWCSSTGWCGIEVPYRTTVVTVDASDPVLPGPAPATPAAPIDRTPDYTG